MSKPPRLVHPKCPACGECDPDVLVPARAAPIVVEHRHLTSRHEVVVCWKHCDRIWCEVKVLRQAA